MYSQLIYFIIALLLLSLEQPGTQALRPPALTALFTAALFCVYVVLCRLAFVPLQAALQRGATAARLTLVYHRILARLNLLVLVVLTIYIYVFDVKFYLQAIPGFEESLTVSGLVGLSVYVLHLGVIWFWSHPFCQQVQGTTLTRWDFVWGNVQFYLALLIPWVLISLVSDAFQVLPKAFRWRFLATDLGQLLLFSLILLGFLAFSPWLVVRLWKCRPLPPSLPREVLEEFCHEHRFRVGDFMFWPILAGEAITAGIIGILPRLRYILMTPSLLALLDTTELQAVAAHEMGHVRRYHIYFYLVFFLGYSVLAYSLQDVLLLLLLKQKVVLNWVISPGSQDLTLFSIVYSLPLVALMVIYFRYIFGFFMRNSERQADIYALELIGHPVTLISSLQKIAVASGHIHDLPSWHHFSIRQRIEFLLGCWRNPELMRRHHRKLYGTAALFLLLVIVLATAGFHFKESVLAKTWQAEVATTILKHRFEMQGGKEDLYGVLGGLLLEQGRFGEAKGLLQKRLEYAPNDPQTLNNLAWLYATAPPPVFDPQAALHLALQAARLQPDGYVLDTLAEAYYVNGRYAEALATIRQAIALRPEKIKYFQEQEAKFEKALAGNSNRDGQDKWD
jgi:Zn-dependent protease with chaperone function